MVNSYDSLIELLNKLPHEAFCNTFDPKAYSGCSCAKRKLYGALFRQHQQAPSQEVVTDALSNFYDIWCNVHGGKMTPASMFALILDTKQMILGDASTRKDEGTVSDSRTNTSPDLPREIWVLDELRQKLTGLVDVGAGREICTFTIEAILMLVTPYLRTTEPVSVSFDDIMNACKHITGTDIGIEFNHKHDARYCPNCNIWLENNCGDKKCELCKDRPERPL